MTPARRLAFFLLGDLLIVAVATFIAFFLRYDGVPPRAVWDDMLFVASMGSAATMGSMAILGVYRVSWRFVSFRDVLLIGASSGFSMGLLAAVALLWHGQSPVVGFPRGVVLLQPGMTFLGISAFRLFRRLQELPRAAAQGAPRGEPTLLVGAGEAGEQVLRSILGTGARAAYDVVGILDDDPLTHGTSIHGVQVLGPVAGLETLTAGYGVTTVIICVAQAPQPFVREVLQRCRRVGVRTVRIVPTVTELVHGEANIQSTREVSLEDLLGRETVRIEADDIDGLLRGKRVLVTGGAGTIGAELCRQVARFGPRSLVVLDIDETRLHDVGLELREGHPGLEVVEALADVRRSEDLRSAFARARPHVVFHAAAYKHVPMMEKYPVAAFEVNVLGTHAVLRAAEASRAERFVLISTDKAVEPSSVMGASKRLAELVLFGTVEGPMVRSAVRFGNVIGSRGSVIPTFERQLSHGGPLTVTHPDIERFFMMTSEAVSLVLQAAALGRGEDLFVLDMGKPVRILDVAREFCRLHGLEPDVDVPIVFTGLRRGEKISEVLSYPDESLEATRHPQLLRTQVRADAPADKILAQVQDIVARGDEEEARAFLQDLFPGLDPHLPPLPSGPATTTLPPLR